MRSVRAWYDEIPEGDSIAIRCESAEPEKQFRVWAKWCSKREDKRWQIVPEHLSFFMYKPIKMDEEWYREHYGVPDFSPSSARLSLLGIVAGSAGLHACARIRPPRALQRPLLRF